MSRNQSCYCSFCNKNQKDSDGLKIIAGPNNSYICSECVKLCLEIIRDTSKSKGVKWSTGTVPSPSKIKEHLDRYIIGQNNAKRKISVAVYNHYKRLEILEKKSSSQKYKNANLKKDKKTDKKSTPNRFSDLRKSVASKTTTPTDFLKKEKTEPGKNNLENTTSNGHFPVDKNQPATKIDSDTSMYNDRLLELHEAFSGHKLEQVTSKLDGQKIYALEDQLDDVEVQKSNVLLIGPTGTGKTLIAQTLAKMMNVPFVVADATTLTEAGYVGEDVENIVAKLYRAANNNIEQTQRGIIFVDEIDKLAKRGAASSSSRDVSGEGVQQALLKIIEGTNATIQVKGRSKLGTQENIQINTSNILFICGGAFEGLDKIVEQRTGSRSLGFSVTSTTENTEVQSKSIDSDNPLQRATPSDLDKFGLIPEFIGRIPIIATLDPLDEDALVKILEEPKNSLVKQYQKLFKFEKVRLTFTELALRAIAKKAVTRKAGARGLRTILESLMLDIMYEMPSINNLKEIVIEEETVVDGKPPKTIYVQEPFAS